jgi:hypothetical protein
MEVTMHPKIRTSPILLSLTIFVLVSMVSGNAVLAGSETINCQAHEGACSLPLGTETVTLEITPRPVTAMQDSSFTVKISGSQPTQSPYLDLGMPAMKMGPNRVILKPAGNGRYTGKGIIVRCKSGRRTWFANVVVPGAGEAKFVFDVVY